MRRGKGRWGSTRVENPSLFVFVDLVSKGQRELNHAWFMYSFGVDIWVSVNNLGLLIEFFKACYRGIPNNPFQC